VLDGDGIDHDVPCDHFVVDLDVDRDQQRVYFRSLSTMFRDQRPR
jgi:hypothetical protein